MAPRQQEDSPLLDKRHEQLHVGVTKMELSNQTSSFIRDIDAASQDSSLPCAKSTVLKATVIGVSALAILYGRHAIHYAQVKSGAVVPTGPYKLLEAQEGDDFFSFYDFYDGPDSIGSAGYNMYVSQSKAEAENIASVITETDMRTGKDAKFVHMSSVGTQDGPRDSVRLEGKTRFNRGLFILDVRHMPDGCGVWPAFWMTDEAVWPRNGEVDILEGVNGQTVSKTALHTSDHCDMYAHVPSYAKTGEWERITGIPDTFTGQPDFETDTPADNCWVMAPHQWANEGCTAVHDKEDTLGAPVNEAGGGVYVLEWDPENRYMKSWVFSPDIPQNLQDAIETASTDDESQRVMPDPSSWGLPYAYFAIGEGTGCSADHFKNMRIVFNLAFCGNVSGNRFSRECPALAKKFNVTNEWGAHDPVMTCNAYIDSNPEALKEAFWKIKGVYVYEREFEKSKKKKHSKKQEDGEES